MPDLEIIGFTSDKAESVEQEIRAMLDKFGSEKLRGDVVYTTHLGGVRVTTHQNPVLRPYIRVWGVPGEVWWMEVFNLLKNHLPYDLERSSLEEKDGFHEGTYEEHLVGNFR